MIENLEVIHIINPSFIALNMKQKGKLSRISLAGQDGFYWSTSQNILLVNDWLTSHKYLTLVSCVTTWLGWVAVHVKVAPVHPT